MKIERHDNPTGLVYPRLLTMVHSSPGHRSVWLARSQYSGVCLHAEQQSPYKTGDVFGAERQQCDFERSDWQPFNGSITFRGGD